MGRRSWVEILRLKTAYKRNEYTLSNICFAVTKDHVLFFIVSSSESSNSKLCGAEKYVSNTHLFDDLHIFIHFTKDRDSILPSLIPQLPDGENLQKEVQLNI